MSTTRRTRRATRQPTSRPRPGGPGDRVLASLIHEVADHDDFQELAVARGWSDGLPVIPPTPDSVRTYLAHLDLPPDHVVAEMPERAVRVTAENLVVNAVLAGAKPRHLGILVAAVSAVADPAFRFNHLASLGAPWPLFLLSGPGTTNAGLHAGQYVFGPEDGDNAVVSRAFSLLMRNVAHASNDGIQRGQWGNLVRWQAMVPERSETPWDPLHVRLGYGPDDNVLMAVSVYPSAPYQVTTVDPSPERILDAVAHAMAGFGGAQWTRGLYVVMLGPHHAQDLADAGWDPPRIVSYLKEHTRATVADLKTRGAWGGCAGR